MGLCTTQLVPTALAGLPSERSGGGVGSARRHACVSFLARGRLGRTRTGGGPDGVLLLRVCGSLWDNDVPSFMLPTLWHERVFVLRSDKGR